jgi:hypothetical protein
MTWTWLFVWNAYWLVFAWLYMSLETKVGGEPPQASLGLKLERRRANRRCNRRVRAPRVHRR